MGEDGPYYDLAEQDAEITSLLVELAEAEAELKAAREASERIGFWMSAALDDPNVCDAMKIDILAWFAALAPSPAGREG